MPTCPDCKGKGQWQVPSNHPLDVYKTDGPVIYDTYTCGTCEGSGIVTDLGLAIYKARGGSEPPPLIN